MAIRALLRRTRRTLGYLFLLSLPFNFQPFIAGFMWAQYHHDRLWDGAHAWARELDDFSSTEQWYVSDALSAWESQGHAAPFHVTRLRSNTWPGKLGVTVPNSHRDLSETDDAPIDKMISFVGAARDVSCHVGFPTEYWIYVSSLAKPEVYAWDRAFVRLLEYHEAHPLPESAAFAYVDCAASPFLCNVWQVDYPAFVHFRINETAEVGDDVDVSAFASSPANLRPVEARIFDLGLRLDSSPLLPGVFPSEFRQMKALTTQDGASSIAETYSEIWREYDRFNELSYFPACSDQGSVLDHSSEIDKWLHESIVVPLGLKRVTDIAEGAAGVFGFAAGSIFCMIADAVRTIRSRYLDERTELEDLFDRLQEREENVNAERFRGDVQQGFADLAW